MSDPKWIGVDLDKTLARYERGDYAKYGLGYIGPPIMSMVERVKAWIAEGKNVRIFTARVCNPDRTWARSVQISGSRIAIQIWCKEHIGKMLPITCEKDFDMIELWDDRAIQVVPNTGERVGGQ